MKSDELQTTEDHISSNEPIPTLLPVLPLRDVVVFPFMIYPVLVGRESSLRAANEALERQKFIFLAAQRNAGTDDPGEDDIYRDGTVAKIIQIMKLPNGLMKILVDGVVQARIVSFVQNDNFLEATVTVHRTVPEITPEVDALMRHVSALFAEYVHLNREVPSEVLVAFENIRHPLRRLFYVAANITQTVETKQKVLACESLKDQYFELARILTSALDVLKIEQDIDTKVHESIQKSQKRYFLQEQMRILQDELGADEILSPEIAKLKEQIEAAGMPKEVADKAMEELNKLKKTPPQSPEFGVSRNYLDWLIAVPWQKRTEDLLDVRHVAKILDADHFGLEKPKERILEHIAVLNLVREMKGQILCFVGPPGVGKTSLGKSIARALGRKFVRISLGGVRDEAEIHGHRRTYIGSMPGKIIQSMRRAGVVNPVILMDEIDKMSMDFRGDPASALLEVLDPEQNTTFNDHYLDVDYDLSSVMFITTANVRYNIPLPLQDRMEIIELPGYLEYDKGEIARRHIIPKQLKEHGLRPEAVRITERAVSRIIQEYTREAGVRNLEREIASVLRKVAKDIVVLKQTSRTRRSPAPVSITDRGIEKYLGVPRFRMRLPGGRRTGSVIGLAWTSVGGTILNVDATIMSGNEKLTLTGQIGEVMQESAQAALSYIRSNAAALGVPDNFFQKKEIHIHLPEGSIHKDGPSAGITMAMAIISAASGRPARNDVAMTGEITLRGEVLPIGGLNEKLLAARRSGLRTVIIPKDNEKDMAEIHPRVKKGLTLRYVRSIDEALPIVFDGKRKYPAGWKKSS